MLSMKSKASHIESHLMFKAFIAKVSVNYFLCCRLYTKLIHTLALKHLLPESAHNKSTNSEAINL